MPDPIHHTNERGPLESILRRLPGFRGYLEKEYRRASDSLAREWLAERLQRSKQGLDALAGFLADQGRLDELTPCDRLRLKLDKLIGRYRSGLQGYKGFFDLVRVDEDFLDKIYWFDTGVMEQVEEAAQTVEQLPQAKEVQQALKEAQAKIEALDKQWDERVDMLRGLR